jgi:hypothetical protein
METDNKPAMSAPEAVDTKEAKEEPCAHYWVIEYANGPVSTGRCKHCGLTKNFYNSLDNVEMSKDEQLKLFRNN